MRLSVVSRIAKLTVFGLVLSSALTLFVQLPVQANESVTLAWVQSSSPDVAGYVIYYGTACGCYSNAIAVGNTTQATITGLVPGVTYYFAAVTVDSAGDESGYSNEASYVMPVTPATLTPAARAGGQYSFTVTGDAGQRYVVQASGNLRDWVSIQTNTAPFQFTDTNTAGFSLRCYRVFYLPP